jgi:hypothetical protein
VPHPSQRTSEYESLTYQDEVFQFAGQATTEAAKADDGGISRERRNRYVKTSSFLFLSFRGAEVQSYSFAISKKTEVHGVGERKARTVDVRATRILVTDPVHTGKVRDIGGNRSENGRVRELGAQSGRDDGTACKPMPYIDDTGERSAAASQPTSRELTCACT